MLVHKFRTKIKELFNHVEDRVSDVENDIQAVSAEIRSLNERLDTSWAAALSLVDSTNLQLKDREKRRDRLLVFFLISNISSFDTVKKVIVDMQKDPRFEVLVGSIHSRMLPNTQFENEPLTHDILNAQGIEHIRMPYDYSGLTLLKALHPDVIVRQTPWDNDLQLHYSSRFLNFTRFVVIDYPVATVMDPPFYPDHEFPMELINNNATRLAWKVYRSQVPGIDEILRDYSLPNMHNQMNVGSPKVAELMQTPARWFRRTKNTKIYWNAHHTVGNDWLNFGLFPKVCDSMLELARSCPDLDIVLGAHPSLIQRLSKADAGITLEEYDEWLDKWDSLPNTSYNHGTPDYAGLIKGADAIWTDGVSLLVEGQIMNKPIIFLERHDHKEFNSLGQGIEGGWHAIPESADMIAAAFQRTMQILEHGDSKSEQQRENRQIWTRYRNPAQTIIDDIATLLTH